MTPADVVARLVARGETVATCESLTGGLVLAELTTVAGSSAVVRGGLVTYATDLKTSLAGVPAELIAENGVVSLPVAEAMARGARVTCGATWGLGLTGVAGPDAVDGLPPGTVCIAVAGPDGVTSVQERFDGDRAAVRRRSVERSLQLLAGVATG
ncbi:MAG TPA: nicotinamide-nucleotide amidohydrolase family protein [Propionibacteriaceae bacterium]|nr:nicotinamide-nucleotide amidohydrolase family protein [Propionibacteriaceae bacterium]